MAKTAKVIISTAPGITFDISGKTFVKRKLVLSRLKEYVNTDDSFGYLPSWCHGAIMIYGGKVYRISYNGFLFIRKYGKYVRRVPQRVYMPGVVYEYEYENLPLDKLGVDWNYKERDKASLKELVFDEEDMEIPTECILCMASYCFVDVNTPDKWYPLIVNGGYYGCHPKALNSSYNIGYIYDNSKQFLMIRDHKVARVDREAAEKLLNKYRLFSNISYCMIGMIRVKYDRAVFTDDVLGVDYNYYKEYVLDNKEELSKYGTGLDYWVNKHNVFHKLTRFFKK